ncbi:MAG TPA: DUF3352 domain-containing protein [Solirubrobacteraceae bacterium]
MRVELGQRRGRAQADKRGRAAGLGFAALAVLLVALAGALAGCGSSASTGSSADPAGLAPSYAPVYIGAVVRPSGKLESEALAAGHALTGRKDPYARLLSVLQTPGSPTLDFGRDVAPWLGENAGLFFTALGSTEGLTGLLRQGLTGVGGAGAEWPFAAGTGARGAIVLDTSDLAKAEKFVSTQAAHAGAHTTSYRGVSFQATAGGDAFATIDKLVVLGSESGVRAVIDTTRSGSSLKGNGTYAQLQSVAPAGALGHVFANPSALTKAHIAKAAGGESEGAGSLPTLLTALGGTRPLNVSLVPSSKSLQVDADLGPAPAGAARASGGLVGALATGAGALGELPSESWLATGLGSIGGGLDGLHNLLSLVGTLASGSSAGPVAPSAAQVTLSISGILEGILTPLKALSANTAKARRDFTSWMGEVGVFAKGTTILELQAAAVIDSTDPAASRAAVGKLASVLNESGAEASAATIPGTEAAIEAKVQGLPVTLVIADGRSASGQAKFVMGLGESSITAALNPSSTMSGSAAYTAAQSALGEGIRPSVAVNFATLLSLLEGVGLSEDPTISRFVPYLRNSTTLAGGGKSLGGGMERLLLVLGLRQPSSG